MQERPVAVATPLDEKALDTLFTQGRSISRFLQEPVSDDTLRAALEAANLGPTAFNATPLRAVFVRSAEAKERLRPALMPGNLDKTMAAPVTAILAHDSRFHEHLPELFPQADLGWVGADEQRARETARFNATLQIGYFILAARAHGLDAGPMAGFSKEAVDAAFFPDGRWKSELLVNLGYGDRSELYARNPRLALDAIARFE